MECGLIVAGTAAAAGYLRGVTIHDEFNGQRCFEPACNPRAKRGGTLRATKRKGRLRLGKRENCNTASLRQALGRF